MTSTKTLALTAWLNSAALGLVWKAHAETVPAPAAAPAPAAESPTQLTEVMVTAQKRTSTVQNTPISITVTSGADPQARGITSFAGLAQSTPGVSLKSEGPGQTEIELRGMTSSGGNSPTVGFYLDDIPLTSPAGAQNGKVVIDPTLYDLNRVEILRGPQGTLYGSGSMDGTVRLITNQPKLDQFEASGQSILSGSEGGGFNHAVNLIVNIPLVQDKLALRLVGSESYTSGWIDRIVAGNYPLPSVDGATRGNVAAAPVIKRYPGANASQTYAVRGADQAVGRRLQPEVQPLLHLQQRSDGLCHGSQRVPPRRRQRRLPRHRPLLERGLRPL